MNKTCTKCSINKNGEEFYKCPTTNDGLHVYCKKCISIISKEWRQDNPEKAKEHRKKYATESSDKIKETNKKWMSRNMDKIKSTKLKKAYGITIEQYKEMLHNQNNSCHICSRSQLDLTKSLAVDHNHKTGKVRGLLCSDCNIGLGCFKDNLKFLEIAISYIKLNS